MQKTYMYHPALLNQPHLTPDVPWSTMSLVGEMTAAEFFRQYMDVQVPREAGSWKRPWMDSRILANQVHAIKQGYNCWSG